jgi:predicted transcriptional regulator
MTTSQKLIARFIAKLADGKQVEAADLLGVEQPTISRYVNGTREPSKPVLMLAKTLLKGAKR